MFPSLQQRIKTLFLHFNTLGLAVGLTVVSMKIQGAVTSRVQRKPEIRGKIVENRKPDFLYSTPFMPPITIQKQKNGGGLSKRKLSTKKKQPVQPQYILAARDHIKHQKRNFSHHMGQLPVYGKNSYLDVIVEYFAEKTPGYENFLLEPQPTLQHWQKIYSIDAPNFCGFTKFLPPNQLAVAKISDHMGLGLFLDPKSELIQPDTFIGFYYGDIRIICEDDLKEDDLYLHSHYIFSLMRFTLDAIDHEALSKARQIMRTPFKDGNTYVLYVDAKENGNATRFLNHGTKTNCAFQMVYIKNTHGKIVPTILVRSVKVIHPGEQLLVDYGKYFFREEDRSPVKIEMTPQTYVLRY